MWLCSLITVELHKHIIKGKKPGEAEETVKGFTLILLALHKAQISTFQ